MKLSINDLISLIRVRQWYKNLVIFLALIFVGRLFSLADLWLSIKGLFVLCLLYSGLYVINDLADRKKDSHNPEKLGRPLASGRVSAVHGAVLGLILMLLGLFWALFLHYGFFLVLLIIALLNLSYSLFLKNILFADILTIATLFVLRAVSGAVLISVVVSPWLILCPFFLSVFLSVGKRHGEAVLLGEKSSASRQVLREYTHQITSPLMTISTCLLIISYALYSFLSGHNFLLLTLPFALFVIFRYYYLITTGSSLVRHPERVWREPALMVGGILWFATTIGILYIGDLLKLAEYFV